MRNLTGGILAFAALLLLTLAACGGGSSTPPPPIQPVGPPPQPEPLWAMLGDGVGVEAWATDTCGLSLGSNDAAFIGGYVGTVTLAPGTPEATTLTGISQEDSYVARVRAADGRLEWAAAVKATLGGFVVVQDVCETPTGIAVCGFFDGDVTFYDQFGIAAGIIFGDTLDDGFVAHYDRNGTLQWAREITSPGFVECLSVTARPDGSIVVGGLFDDIMTPGALLDTMTPIGLQDSFLAAYSTTGSFLWSTQYSGIGTGWISLWGVASVNQLAQDLVISGDFAGMVSFGPGFDRTSVGGTIDSFIARIDGTTGAIQWLQTITGTGNEQSLDVVVAVSGGNTFIRLAGGFEDTATFGELPGTQQMLTSAGQHDGFVVAFNGTGTLQWAHRVGGTEEDYFSDVWVRPSDGAVMASGFFTDSCTFSGSAVTLTSHGIGDTDALLAGFTAGGTVDWAVAMGGTGDDYGLGISEVPGNPGDIYATGTASGPSVTFGVGLGTQPIVGTMAAFQLRFTVN